MGDASLQTRMDIERVRTAVSGLIGDDALGLAEGLGRVVVTTFSELTQPGHFSAATGGLSSIAGEPLFRDKIARQRAARSRAMAAVGDLDRGRILASATSAGWQLILPDRRAGGGWLRLPFDLNGFGEPIAHESAQDAMEDARALGYGERDDGALDRIKDAPSFQRGLFGADVARRLLEGGISEEEACDLMAEHERSLRTLHSISTAGAQAFTLDGGRSIMLLADRIAPGEEKAVFLHEIVHRHARSLLAAGVWAGLLDRVRSWRAREAGSVERRVHDASLARALDADASRGALFEEEWLAYAVEEAVLAGVTPSVEGREDSAEFWLDGVVSALRGVIHHVTGSPSPDLTPQMLVDMAYAMAQLDSPQRVARILERLSPEERGHLRAVMGPLATDSTVSAPSAPPGPKVQLTSAIAEWLSSSVATSDGKPGSQPLVVFHGTRANFHRFRPSAMGNLGRGIYFASQKEQAAEYGDRVIEAVLKLENPWVVDLEYDTPAALAADFDSPSVDAVLSLPGGRALMEQARAGNGLYGPALQALLQARGHDGVIGRYRDGSTEFVVFSPDQVLRLDLAVSRQVPHNSVPEAVVYHWTDVDFDRFDIGMGQLGAHFGSLQAARDRARGRDRIGYVVEEDEGDYFVVPDAGPSKDEWLGPFPTQALARDFVARQPQLIDPLAARLDIQRPVRLPDLGGWSAWPVIQALPDGTLSGDEVERVMSADDRDATLRSVLMEKGFDGVVYTNEVEDPGSESYIAFRAEQITLYGRSSSAEPGVETDSRLKTVSSLPPDMVVLLQDLFEDAGRPLPRSVPVRKVAVARFPAVELASGSDDRSEAHALAMVAQPVPPVIINGDAWLDGRHRLHAARIGAVQSVAAIDLDGLLPPPGPEGLCLGRLKADLGPAFDRWFASSKVVDELGWPLVVYHGTTANIAEFDGSKSGAATGAAWAAMGHFFTENSALASDFTKGKKWFSQRAKPKLGANVMPVYLSIQNPLMLPASRALPMSGSLERVMALRAEAEAAGHDGIIIEPFRSSFGFDDTTNELATPQYIAFRSEQIKSATGNAGTFDPANPDIRFSNPHQARTHEFEQWFGSSQVVDVNGDALPVYRGYQTGTGRNQFTFYSDNSRVASTYATKFGNVALEVRHRSGDVQRFETRVEAREYRAGNGGKIVKVDNAPTMSKDFLSLQNPLVVDADGAQWNQIRNPFAKQEVVTEHARRIWAAKKDMKVNGRIYTVEQQCRDIDAEYFFQLFVTTERLAELAKEHGHDGLIVKNVYDVASPLAADEALKSTVFAAFKADQIKSAIGDFGSLRSSRTGNRNTPNPPETPSFKNWFGDSKVVDADGKPLVVYHGTMADFTVFRISGDVGAHFSTTPAAANYLADNEGGRVMPVYLSLQNPVRVKDLGAWDAYELLDELIAAGALTPKEAQPLREAIDVGDYSDEMLRETLETKGYDGVVYLNRGEGIDTESGGGFESAWSDARFLMAFPSAKDAYIAFRPEQIKSATGNNGEFSPSSPDIRFSKPGQTRTPEFERWFGGSQVVDPQGKPLVVYHGTIVRPMRDGVTEMGNIAAFDRMFTTRFRQPSIDTVGSWFSTNPGEGGAEMYAGGGRAPGAAIYPVFLSIKNPQVTTFQLMTRRARLLHNGNDDGRMIGAPEVEAYRTWLKAMGKDGIKIEGSGNDGSTEFDQQDVWIALEPEQIKSAVGNSGEFSSLDADIRFSTPASARTKQMETPEFKKWFVDSKVVDEQGRPLVVYHGGQVDITEFKASPHGIFFARRPEAASAYAMGADDDGETITNGANVIAAYLSLKDPLVVSDEWLSIFGRRAPADPFERGHSFRDDFVDSEIYARDAVIAEAKRLGHDGLVLPADMLPVESMGGDWEEQPAYVAFHPEQIKSATGNGGGFDANNPDIRFSKRDQTRTPEFKKWFGDSKILDGHGHPLKVYHGTAANFNSFLPSRCGEFGPGIYFSDSPSEASGYAGTNSKDGSGQMVMPVYLSIQHPLVISDASEFWSEVGDVPDEMAIDVLIGKGYDGVMFKRPLQKWVDGLGVVDLGGMQTHFVAFRPEQIKSAVGNSGEFSSLDADIRFSTPASARTKQTETPEFKNWFGASQVVDDQRRPQVLYHGTGKGGFSVFDRGRWRTAYGHFFTPDRSAADLYNRGASSQTYEVFLRAVNPLRLDMILEGEQALPQWLKGWIAKTFEEDSGDPLEQFHDWIGGADLYRLHIGRVQDDLMAEAEDNGHDAVAFYDARRDGGVALSWVAFEASQIKSATDNNGQFSLSDPDIRFSKRDQTRTPEFKKWFVDSKVVDERGRPLVVYHGTAADFDSFDNAKTGANDRGLWGRGHYFSAVTENANSYALRQGDGARVIPAYVSIKNPLVLRTGVDLVTRLPDGTNYRDLVGPNLDGSKIKEMAISGGHDGVIQIKPDGSIGDLVAYSPTQIKSATGNSGDYNPSNPDIRFSKSDRIKSNEFRNWFGASKVVDAEGRPLVVFHGTGSDFNIFQSKRGGLLFFSTEIGFAQEYAEDSPFVHGEVKVMEVYLSAQNPWDYKNPKHVAALIQSLEVEGIEVDDDYRESLEDGDWMAIEQGLGALDAIKAMGHDGIWMTEGSDMTRNIAVFHHEQIKSAADNNGDFNPYNPDIRMSSATAAQAASTAGRTFPRRSTGAPDSPVIDAGQFIAEFAALKGVDLRLAPLEPDRHAAQYFDHDGPEVWIEWIEAHEKGAGARAMRELIEAADRTNTLLRLSVDGDEGGGLYRFYEQFGFEQDPAGGEIMERLPRRDDSMVLRAASPIAPQSREDRLATAMAGTAVATRSGRPKVVYHRTAADIIEFDVSRGDLGAHFGTREQAMQLREGRMRDGENTMPVYLNIRNPVRLTDKGSFHADAVAPQLQRKGLIDKLAARRLFLAGDRGTVEERRQANAEIRALLLQAGFDGVVYTNNTEGPGDSWIAFDPRQVKSAIGNCGTFDPTDPDIRASMPRMRS